MAPGHELAKPKSMTPLRQHWEYNQAVMKQSHRVESRQEKLAVLFTLLSIQHGAALSSVLFTMAIGCLGSCGRGKSYCNLW